MAWTVAVLIIVAGVAVGPLEAKEIEERQRYHNIDNFLVMNSEMNEEHHFFPNKTGNTILRKGGSQCKAKDMCFIMDGTCVTNATECDGKLVPGCNGKNCQCCVPSTMETKINSLEQKLQTMQINSLEQKLQTMQSNLTITNSNINTVLQTLKDIITDANSKLNLELQNLKDNLTDSNSKVNMELQNIQANFTNTNSKLSAEFQTLRDNLTDANSNLSMEFQVMKENLTNDNSNQNIEFQTLRDNLTDANSNLNQELQTLKDNLTDANSNLNTEFQTLRDNFTKEFQSMSDKLNNSISNLKLKLTGCPAGFFHTAGSTQCYKFYNDTMRTYDESKAKCQAQGLVLPEPTDPLSLRKYLVEALGTRTWAHVFLGALGTGTYYRWERSGQKISNTDPLWHSGQPGGWLTTKSCLIMLVEKSHLSNQPTRPFCTHWRTSKFYTLCEYVN